MKKWIAVLVVSALACAAWAVAVFVTGQRMEKKYYALLNDTSLRSGGIFLASRNYDRGFLTARAVTEVRLQLPLLEGAAGPGGVCFEIIHDFRHGPLLTGRTIDGRRHWGALLGLVESRLAPGETDCDLLRLVPELAKSWSYSVLDWQGGSENRFDMPAFRRDLGNGAAVAFGGLQGDMTAADGMKRLEGHFRLPKMELSSADGGMRVEEGASDFVLEQAFGGLYLGEVKSRIAHLLLHPPGQVPLDFTGIQVSSVSRRDGHLVEFGELIELQSLAAGDRVLGSGRLDVQMRNLNGPALAKFRADLAAIRQIEGEEEAAALRQAFFELLSGLSTEAPQVEIRQLQVVAPQGRFEGHALMRLAGKEKLGPGGLAAAFDRFLAEAEFKVSRELALALVTLHFTGDGGEKGAIAAAGREPELPRKKAADQLAAWTTGNLLTEEGDNLRFAAAFRDGQITVNGAPFGGRGPVRP